MPPPRQSATIILNLVCGGDIEKIQLQYRINTLYYIFTLLI
jgi:hypothetical protein